MNKQTATAATSNKQKHKPKQKEKNNTSSLATTIVAQGGLGEFKTVMQT